MTTPTTILDADITLYDKQDYAFVIEAGTIWRASNVRAAGASTWEAVYTSAEFTGGSELEFMRVRCASNKKGLVFVLGYCENAADSSKVDAWIFRSANYGLTWEPIRILEKAGEYKDYKVTIATARADYLGDSVNKTASSIHTRIDQDTDHDPWALMFQLSFTKGLGNWISQHATATTIHTWSATNLAVIDWDIPHGRINQNLDVGERATAASWLTDYFGGGKGVAWEQLQSYLYGLMPAVPCPERVSVDASIGHGSNPNTLYITSWVFWHAPNPDVPKALDVANTNNDWLYVGFRDCIYKSEDSGFTWKLLYGGSANEGANDIRVDRLLAGVIYYWGCDGNFYTMIAGQRQASTLSETAASRQFNRIIDDPLRGGYRLWTIDGDGNLKKRYLASWSTLQTNLSGFCGLRSYVGSLGAVKILYMTATDIYYSIDDGVTVASKKGGWSIASPVGAFLYERDYS